MQQRHRIAVRGPNRQRLAAAGHGTGEADRPRRRCAHRRVRGSTDVDPTVLAACIRVVAEDERS
jgi:hypothetical protein